MATLWMDLQNSAVGWHVQRFPNASKDRVGLKMAEEVGEVAKALNALAGQDSATGSGEVPPECADVIICVMVLMGRWFPAGDVMLEVVKKLNQLKSKFSTHPASLGAIHDQPTD